MVLSVDLSPRYQRTCTWLKMQQLLCRIRKDSAQVTTLTPHILYFGVRGNLHALGSTGIRIYASNCSSISKRLMGQDCVSVMSQVGYDNAAFLATIREQGWLIAWLSTYPRRSTKSLSLTSSQLMPCSRDSATLAPLC